MTSLSKEGRKTIRVVIAEDQGMVLGALAALLEIEGDISVVARARDDKKRWTPSSPTGPTYSSPTSRCRKCQGWKSRAN